MKKIFLIFILFLINFQVYSHDCTDTYFNFHKNYRKNINSNDIIKIKCSLYNKHYAINNFSSIFDDNLDKNLRKFQRDNGFFENGVYDKLMWINLNSLDLDKTRLLELSFNNFYNFLERLDYSQDKFIVVNIPTYTLYGFERNLDNNEFELKFKSKIIVGKPEFPTPLEDMNINYLKFNPNWTLPVSFLKKYYILDEHGNRKLDIEKVEKSGFKIDENNQVYQPRGINNALGKLKFDTDSKNAIYLHDTNKKNLFNNNKGDFSHGCIRVKEYKKMAYWLKNKEVVNKWLNQDETHFERVDKDGVRVYVVYIPSNLKGNSFVFAGIKNDKDEYDLDDYIFYNDIYHYLDN